MANLTEDTDTLINHMHRMLNRLGLDDATIISGIKVSNASMERFAARYGIDVSEAELLFSSLLSKLRSDNKKMNEMAQELSEDDDRFAYEKDALGNVTIRDSESGKSKYLVGDKATNLLVKLAAAKDQQAVLGSYMSLMEAISLGDSSSFADEIASKTGTFNFPWRANGQTGFGTASYRGVGPRDVKVKVIDLRDIKGEEIKAPYDKDIENQAYRFMGKV